MPNSPQPAALPGDEPVIGVVGLGYVGLPLAIEFGKQFDTRGYDVDRERVRELGAGHDGTREVPGAEFERARRLTFTADSNELQGCDVFLVAVPTPIDEHKRPDLAALEAASRTVGGLLERGNVVVFESTVYPGATEEVCVPLLEAESGLRFNLDFYAGYSPERINPGDRTHRLTDIVKVTSGSTPDALAFVDALYRRIVTAGTFPVENMRTAEAAKIIENTQRDLNIALINEFAMIFERLDVDTESVLQAAATKWNFLPFRPGLVGGHCIGVDPYYLTHKAEAVGHHTELILAGRRINDAMAAYVAERVVRLMRRARIHVTDSRILVLGLAFKENCPDVRNTKVVELVESLQRHGAVVDVHDPWVAQARSTTGVPLVDDPATGNYDAIVIAVAHDAFRALGGERIRAFGRSGAVIFDVKHLLAVGEADESL